MPQVFWKESSPRHGFKYDRVPPYRGSMFGGSIVRYDMKDYGAILDCVYEMADDIASANGVSHEQAISEVLKAEGWSVLPNHQKMILNKLKDSQ